MKRLSTAVVLCVVCLALSTSAHAADPSGTWIMANGRVTVRLSKCAANLCARIVGLAEPVDREGRRKVDKLNPKNELRTRPLMGLTLASNLAPAGNGVWKGTIYNPDDGRTYSASLKLGGSTIKVTGCMAGVFCKSQTLRRK